MNEQDVRDLLNDLADTPAPPSRVDVPRAVTTVRRRARTRAVTSVAASILVVGLAAGLTYAVVDRSPPSTGSPSPPSTGAPATPTTSAPRQFDPLVRYAEFGWLPEQHTLDWRITSITGERFALNAGEYVPDPANGPGAAQPAASVGVRLYAADIVPQTEQPLEVLTPNGSQTVHYGPVSEAPPVNGAPAYWVGVPGDTETTILKWRYAPGAWAELTVSRLGGDARQTALRIAGDLRVGGTERLRFPFRFTGLPAGLRPVSSEIEEGGLNRSWQATLDLNARADGQGPTLSVAVHPTSQSDSRDPNTSVDGHPARHETFEGDHHGVPQYSDRLFVFDRAGLQTNIYIDAKSAADAARLGRNGVLGVYRTLTLQPDPADWTDQPLR